MPPGSGHCAALRKNASEPQNSAVPRLRKQAPPVGGRHVAVGMGVHDATRARAGRQTKPLSGRMPKRQSSWRSGSEGDDLAGQSTGTSTPATATSALWAKPTPGTARNPAAQAQGGAPSPQVADVEPKTTLLGSTALGGARCPEPALLSSFPSTAGSPRVMKRHERLTGTGSVPRRRRWRTLSRKPRFWAQRRWAGHDAPSQRF